MRIALILLTLTLAILFASPALGQSVYKWTDEHGVVHYGDRPPIDESAEQVNIAPAPPLSVNEVAEPDATDTSQATATPVKRQRLRVLMYGRMDCGYCAKARSYFARRRIPFRELDVADSNSRAYAEWKRHGGTGVPLFIINGKVARGFSAAAMDKRLATYGW